MIRLPLLLLLALSAGPLLAAPAIDPVPFPPTPDPIPRPERQCLVGPVRMDPPFPCSGTQATFSASSTCPAMSWLWEFGEAGTPGRSTDPRPTITLGRGGVYTGSVTITDAQGNPISTTFPIEVFESPEILSVGYAPEAITVGMQVDFWAETEAKGTNWKWKFEGADPATSTDEHPRVRMLASGTLMGEVTAESTCGPMRKIFHYTVGAPSALVLTGHTAPVLAVAFSPDGSQIASGGEDDIVRVWDSQTGKQLRELAGHTGDIYDIAWKPEGDTFASCSQDGTIRFWDRTTKAATQEITAHDGQVVASIDWAPQQSVLASGGYDGTVKLWNTADNHLIATLDGGSTQVRSVAIDSTGLMLASAEGDDTVRLWDLSDNSLKQSFTGHPDQLKAVSWAANGPLLASVSIDGTLAIREISNLSSLEPLKVNLGSTNTIAISPSGSLIAAGGRDMLLHLLDSQTGETLLRFDGHTGSIYGLSWEHDGSRLATASGDKTIRIWDIARPSAPVE